MQLSHPSTIDTTVRMFAHAVSRISVATTGRAK